MKQESIMERSGTKTKFSSGDKEKMIQTKQLYGTKGGN